MDKKQGNIIERHIEKAVLAIMGLVCAFILVKYVVLSPYVFKFDNKQFAAGQLDRYIEEHADKIKVRINTEPKARQRYEPNEPQFLSKLDCSVNIETRINWPVPSSVEQRQERKYRIPAVGAVTDVSAESIRSAAYVPKVEITPENQNDEKSYEPNDIDLVTVQGSFDIAGLRESFQSCFAGKDVREEWRDTSFAHPVFAAVQLERQSQGPDGQWKDEWENVGRPKTEPYVAEFRAIEDVNELPSGGVMVRLLKMSDPKVQVSLLQPEPYQIASSEEEWFPPVLHKKYLTVQKEKELQERRDEMAKQRDEKKQEQDQMRQQRQTSRPQRTVATEPTGRGGGGGMGAEEYMKMLGGGAATPSRSTPSRTVRDRRTEQTEDKPVKAVKPVSETVYDEMNKIVLKSKDFSKVTEPIVFWAYDDTAQPGHNYRYRVRIGVFNPVAGTGQIVAEDAPYNNKAILWSQYSEVTDAVEIPQRMYFFPVEVQEASKQVDMQVCRYALGYWHSAQFKVKRGEVIGNHIAIEPNEKDAESTQPEVIDYTTGAVLVDVVAINDWTGDKNLQARHYFDVLYSYDGIEMERMASKQMYWPEELRIRYNEVKSMEKKPKLAFKTWGQSGTRGGGQRYVPGIAPGRGNAPMTAEDYMQMLRGGQPGK